MHIIAIYVVIVYYVWIIIVHGSIIVLVNIIKNIFYNSHHMPVGIINLFDLNDYITFIYTVIGCLYTIASIILSLIIIPPGIPIRMLVFQNNYILFYYYPFFLLLFHSVCFQCTHWPNYIGFICFGYIFNSRIL